MNDPIQELILSTVFSRQVDSVLVPEIFPSGTPVEKVTFHVCELTSYEREQYEDAFRKQREANGGSLVGYRANLVAHYLCNASGDRLVLTNGQVDPQKVAKLSGLLQSRSSVALDRLFDAASRLNGLTPEDAEAIAKKSLAGLSKQPENVTTSE